MKKILLFCLFLICYSSLKAQSYIGLLTDNYSGVHGVISNPANIADSRFKTDINLVGISTFLANDYMGVNFMDAIKPGYDFEDSPNFSSSSANKGQLNLDVLGPSFMFNLTPKSSIAVFSRARTFFNAVNIDGQGVEDIIDEKDQYFLNANKTTIFTQAWAEFGLSYARVLKDNGIHFLKGGFSLKYLQGIASAYAYGRGVTADFDRNGISGSTIGSINTTGDGYVGIFDYDALYDDYEVGNYDLPAATGFGLDLGFVYEWRPKYKDYIKSNAKGDSLVLKDKNKYKLKLGVSLTDIGSINYKEGRQDVYNINVNNIPGDAFTGDLEFIEAVNGIYNSAVTTYGYKTKLPTALHINADWSFTKHFYVNLNTDLSLVKKGKAESSYIANMVSLTPRLESKWASVFVPLNMIYSNFTAGFGLRTGPFYLGSGSLITALASDNVRAVDAYAGIKIPVYQPSPKDKDEDGVIDKLDLCPKVAGPIENNGCPWEDTDNDTILDNEDKCIDVAGPVENNGCPWLDTDADTVLDKDDACIDVAGPVENKGCPWGDADNDTVLDNVDQCVDVAGSVENNGCPWEDKDGDTVLDKEDKCPELPGPVENNGCPWQDSDGDTVLDKDDKCVKVFGTVANNGCPELSVDVQKTLNQYAKTILFNSAKATIKEESNAVLKDIVSILNEYPNANFSIEGHTDSDGSDAANQVLSEGRANAVMVFLIENGISPSRLSSKGFGESKPVASNTTASGKALNRRVEINLVK